MKLFVVFNVIAIVSWVMPSPAPAVASGLLPGTFSEKLMNFNQNYLKNSPIQLYILSTGLWQSWDMFAPNPANVDIYPTAEITLRDGQVLQYEYPRMYALSRTQKYQKERYRKFFEHANNDAYLYPVFARRVLYLMNIDPSNPAVKVVLKRHWYEIPRVESFADYSSNLWSALMHHTVTSEVLMPSNPPVPQTYNEYAFYTYYPLTGKGQIP